MGISDMAVGALQRRAVELARWPSDFWGFHLPGGVDTARHLVECALDQALAQSLPVPLDAEEASAMSQALRFGLRRYAASRPAWAHSVITRVWASTGRHGEYIPQGVLAPDTAYWRNSAPWIEEPAGRILYAYSPGQWRDYVLAILGDADRPFGGWLLR